MPRATRRISQLSLLALLIALPGLSACEPGNVTQDAAPKKDAPDKPNPEKNDSKEEPKDINEALHELKSNLPRENAKAPKAELEAAIKREQLELGLDMLRQAAIEDPEHNNSMSPYSVQAALAMLMPVAQENTLDELAKTLGGDTPADVLNALRYFDQELQKRNSKDQGEDEVPTVLSSANRIFLKKSYAPSTEGLDALGQSFGTGLYQADFEQQASNARDGINKWIEKQTRGLIKDFYNEDQITSDTRWLLTNALYLKAPWSIGFAEPTSRSFTLLDGKKVDVPTLHSSEQIADYGKSDDLDWVALPFQGDKLSLMLLFPQDGNFNELQEKLDAKLVEGLLEKKKNGLVEVRFPTFSINTSFSGVKKILEKRGLKSLFNSELDLGKLFAPSSEQKLDGLDALGQSTVLEINEEGIEAAAVTGGTDAGMPEDEKEPEFKLLIDRPFFFIVRDIPTGQTLFTGRVIDPSK